MKRALGHDQVTLTCHRGHPPEPMREAGYSALQEAGAAQTILGLLCPRCQRQLVVMTDPPVSPDLAGIDEAP